jgi:hypothetical protein
MIDIVLLPFVLNCLVSYSITMPTDGNYYYASGPIDQLGNETDNYISTLQWVVLCCCAVVCVCACACMCANTDLMIYVP